MSIYNSTGQLVGTIGCSKDRKEAEAVCDSNEHVVGYARNNGKIYDKLSSEIGWTNTSGHVYNMKNIQVGHVDNSGAVWKVNTVVGRIVAGLQVPLIQVNGAAGLLLILDKA